MLHYFHSLCTYVYVSIQKCLPFDMSHMCCQAEHTLPWQLPLLFTPKALNLNCLHHGAMHTVCDYPWWPEMSRNSITDYRWRKQRLEGHLPTTCPTEKLNHQKIVPRCVWIGKELKRQDNMITKSTYNWVWIWVPSGLQVWIWTEFACSVDAWPNLCCLRSCVEVKSGLFVFCRVALGKLFDALGNFVWQFDAGHVTRKSVRDSARAKKKTFALLRR
jgi:hypothetical protein